MNKPVEPGLGGTHFIRIDPQRSEFLVPRWAFTDPAVLDKERAEIFGRCWIYAGHASEIPKSGDFVARKVGGRQLFLWRGEDGAVKVYFNTCTHRGAMVCREKQGNAKRLTCPYHGWTYDTQGGMVEQPGASGFPDGFFDNGAKNLVSPAQVDVYRDFIFVNFDPAGVDLKTYLAGAAEYLDLVADQGEHGMEVTPGEQVYSMRANWKLLYENSADGYHAITAHASYFDYLRATVGVFREDFNPHDVGGGGKSLGNGHAVIEYQAPWGRPVAQWVPPRLMNAALLDAFLMRAAKQGLVVKVSAKRYFLPSAMARFEAVVRELAARPPRGQFTAAEFRDRVGIGRNAVIEILEYFDRIGLTHRAGDLRTLLDVKRR